MEDVSGRALMIHEGGDNYADEPKPLGGGGARIACGVIPGTAKAAGRQARRPGQTRRAGEARQARASAASLERGPRAPREHPHRAPQTIDPTR